MVFWLGVFFWVCVLSNRTLKLPHQGSRFRGNDRVGVLGAGLFCDLMRLNPPTGRGANFGVYCTIGFYFTIWFMRAFRPLPRPEGAVAQILNPNI